MTVSEELKFVQCGECNVIYKRELSPDRCKNCDSPELHRPPSAGVEIAEWVTSEWGRKAIREGHARKRRSI